MTDVANDAIEVRSIGRDELASIVPGLSEIETIPDEDRDLARDMLDWWCFRNPAGEGVYAGAFEDGRLAGVASITPKRFVVEGRGVMCAEIGRTITHPAFRGRGIFSKLVNYLVGESARRGYQLVYGTPNEASGRIYVGRLNFDEMFHWQRAIRPLDWRRQPLLGARLGVLAPAVGRIWDLTRPLRAKPGAFSTEARPDDDVPGLVADASRDLRCVVERTPEYLGWRYSRPDRSYHHVHVRDSGGQLRGWAAIALLPGEGGVRAHVGDYWSSTFEAGAVRRLLGAAAQFARTHEAIELYVPGRSARLEGVLTRLGFFSKASIMPVIGFAPGGAQLDPTFSAWEYRDSDADMF